jgi:hypothetical protein
VLDDTDTGRDWLDLLRQDAWPEPWRSMGAGAPAPQPDDIPDPGAPEPREFDPNEILSIDWTRGTPHRLFESFVRWDAAIQRAAETGDVRPLIELLHSDEPLHRDVRDRIAELLALRQIKRRPGRQATPGRITLTEGQLNDQAAYYRYYRRIGMDHDGALRAAIMSFKGDEIEMLGKDRPGDDELTEMTTDEEVERLNDRIRGKRGSSRRMQRR